MKLLLFAHIPPPHHGQSVMIAQTLEGFGGDQRGRRNSPEAAPPIACYHIDARFSSGMSDIGHIRMGKFGMLLRYCWSAIVCRFRYGTHTFYHVPAPPKRSALYRDWIILLLCRPFFSGWIMHWQAAGLREWLDRDARWWEKWVTERLYNRITLSVVLSKANIAEAASFHPKAIQIIPNAIADPCPDFSTAILPQKSARAQKRKEALEAVAPTSPSVQPILYRLLYVAHCTREKGIFDALEAVAIANANTSEAPLMKVHLTVAGGFFSAEEEAEFRDRIAQDDLKGSVTYFGFANTEQKRRLFEEADCLCFPTFYSGESFPLTIIEALAFGLSVITTDWRGTTAALPEGALGIVPLHSPCAIAARFRTLAKEDEALKHREHFLAHFTLQRYLENLAQVLSDVENAK